MFKGYKVKVKVKENWAIDKSVICAISGVGFRIDERTGFFLVTEEDPDGDPRKPVYNRYVLENLNSVQVSLDNQIKKDLVKEDKEDKKDDKGSMIMNLSRDGMLAIVMNETANYFITKNEGEKEFRLTLALFSESLEKIVGFHLAQE